MAYRSFSVLPVSGPGDFSLISPVCMWLFQSLFFKFKKEKDSYADCVQKYIHIHYIGIRWDFKWCLMCLRCAGSSAVEWFLGTEWNEQ